jgi:hypothetical protein
MCRPVPNPSAGTLVIAGYGRVRPRGAAGLSDDQIRLLGDLSSGRFL